MHPERTTAVKKIPVVLLALTAALAAACSPKANDPADVQAVKDTGPAYDKFANAADAAGLSSSFYAADAIRMDPNQPASAGTEAIRAALDKSYARSSESVRDVIDDVHVLGSLAVAKGTFDGKSTSKITGTEAPVKGKFVTLYRKEADGSWKAVWDIYNSDLPEAGTTADGADEKAIVAIENSFGEVMSKRDTAAVEQVLAKEWVETDNGETLTRAQVLAALKGGAVKVESAAVRGLDIHVFGDAAVATMTMEVKGTMMGKPFPAAHRSTDFFVRRDGRWQIVNTQNTTITP
jgi:ketosteroid isomerase-like protein